MSEKVSEKEETERERDTEERDCARSESRRAGVRQREREGGNVLEGKVAPGVREAARRIFARNEGSREGKERRGGLHQE